jgi:hypothetical protein
MRDNMKTYTEKDGFVFQYDPKKKLIYYPYNREITPEVKEEFEGYKVQLIIV